MRVKNERVTRTWLIRITSIRACLGEMHTGRYNEEGDGRSCDEVNTRSDTLRSACCRRSVLAVLCVCIFFCAGRAVNGGGKPTTDGDVAHISQLPDACRAALEASRICLEQLSIRSEVSRAIPQEIVQAKKDQLGDSQWYTVIDRGRFFQRTNHTTNMADGSNTSIELEQAHDGRVFYSGTPNKGSTPLMTKFLGDVPDDVNATVYMIEEPYLKAVGVMSPSTPNKWAQNNLQPIVLWAANSGGLLECHDKNDIVSVTIELPATRLVTLSEQGLEWHLEKKKMFGASPEAIAATSEWFKKTTSRRPIHRYRIDLDATHGFCASRIEEEDGEGDLLMSRRCMDFKKYAIDGHEIWLPQTCVEQQHYQLDPYEQPRSKPGNTVTYHLVDFTLGQHPEVSFELNYTAPGSLIRDRTTAEGSKEVGSTKVPSSNAELRRIGEGIGPWWRSRRILLMVGNGILLLIFVVLIMRARNKKA